MEELILRVLDCFVVHEVFESKCLHDRILPFLILNLLIRTFDLLHYFCVIVFRKFEKQPAQAEICLPFLVHGSSENEQSLDRPLKLAKSNHSGIC